MSQIEADKYLGELGIDRDKYLGDLNASLGMSQIEADKQMNADTLAAQREIARMESELQTKIAQIESASETERQRLITEASIIVAQIEDANKRYGYELDAETQKAKAKLQAQADKYGYDTQYNLGLYESMNSATKEAVEASSTEKQKALAIRREDGEAAYNEYLASLPEEKRQSVSAYVDQYYVDESTVIPDADAQGIAMNIANAVNQGEDPTKVLDYWLTKYYAQHPEHNTSQSRTKILELVESILQ
jgi:hypothetical protein